MVKRKRIKCYFYYTRVKFNYQSTSLALKEMQIGKNKKNQNGKNLDFIYFLVYPVRMEESNQPIRSILVKELNLLEGNFQIILLKAEVTHYFRAENYHK